MKANLCSLGFPQLAQNINGVNFLSQVDGGSASVPGWFWLSFYSVLIITANVHPNRNRLGLHNLWLHTVWLDCFGLSKDMGSRCWAGADCECLRPKGFGLV